MVCGECVAVMGEIKEFREKIETSQDILKHFIDHLEQNKTPEDADPASIKDEDLNEYDEPLMDTYDDLVDDVKGEGGTDEEEEAHTPEETKDQDGGDEKVGKKPQPKTRRTGRQSRQSLPRSTTRVTRSKNNDDGDAEWKPVKTYPYVSKAKGIRKPYRPRNVVAAEKREKALQRKERLLAEKREKRLNAPLGGRGFTRYEY